MSMNVLYLPITVISMRYVKILKEVLSVFAIMGLLAVELSAVSNILVFVQFCFLHYKIILPFLILRLC